MEENLKYRISLEDLFSKGINTAEGNAKSFEGSVDSLGGSFNRLRNQIAGAIGIYQTFNFAKSVVDTGATFERAEIQLKTLLKSADKAKEVFTDIQNESTKSPFTFQEILKGNAALISTGLTAKRAKEDFTNLSNAIAATGGTNDELGRMVMNLQQIRNTGKATALDIKQFGYAGINLYSLLNDYYKANHIALQNQKQDYETITGALKLAAQEGGQYYNALNNLADSTSGRISNLSDSFDIFKDTLFKAVKPSVNSVVAALTEWMNKGKEFIRFLQEHEKQIKLIAVGVAGAAAAYSSYKIAVEAAAIAQSVLNGALAISPLGLAVTGVGLLAAAYYELTENIGKSIQEQEKFDRENMKTWEAKWIKDERENVDRMSAGKSAKERLKIIESEIAEAKKAQEGLNFNSMADRQRNDKYRAIIAELEKMKKEKALKTSINSSDDGLGSGLSEPKESKIKAITIHINQPFKDQKITMGGGNMNPGDMMQGLVEFLISLTQEATIVSTE